MLKVRATLFAAAVAVLLAIAAPATSCTGTWPCSAACTVA